MEPLNRQIRQAQRRLFVRSLADKLIRSLAVALWVAAVAIAWGRFRTAPFDGWDAAWLACAGAASLGVALAWSWIGRADRLAAAEEIDRRFALDERVASAATLDDHERASPMGEALVADVIARTSYLNVGERFNAWPRAKMLLPLVPAAAAVALALGLSGPGATPTVAATSEENQQVRESAKQLAARLEENRKQAREAGLEETDELLAELERGTRLLADTQQADRKQGLMALNDLVKQAETRRSQLAGSTALRAQLERLQALQQGPAEKLGSALRRGDLQRATDELAKLGGQISAGELDAAQRETLARQLNEAERSLEKVVQAHARAKQELAEQIARAREAGDTATAERLQEQLDGLSRQDEHTERLADMAKQLRQASEHLSANETRQAAQALDQLGQCVSNTGRELEELETLDSALAEMAQCKNAMACRECQGKGCAACQGLDHAQHPTRAQSGPPGHAPGQGTRDDRKADAGHYDSRVSQQIGRGASVVTGTADGPNRKGQVLEDIKGQFEQPRDRQAEAISGQRLPREYRDHARTYFDALREGAGESTAKPRE